MSSILLSVLSLWAKLPRPILQLLGNALGSLHYFANTRPAQVTAANLAVCGQDADLRHESLRETGKTLLETPAIWFGTQDRLEDWEMSTTEHQGIDLSLDKGFEIGLHREF